MGQRRLAIVRIALDRLRTNRFRCAIWPRQRAPWLAGLPLPPDQTSTIESPSTEMALFSNGFVAGPFATVPSRLNLLP